MKNKQTKPQRLLSVRGVVLTLPTLDQIEGPALVYISPESIFISDNNTLKIYKKCSCVIENIEAQKTNIKLKDFIIPILIDEENGIDVDLKNISYLFKTLPEREFEKLPSEEFLIFDFGTIRTKSITSQEDIYTNYSVASLFEELWQSIVNYEYGYIISAIEKVLRKKISSTGSLDVSNLQSILGKLKKRISQEPAEDYREILGDLQTLIEQKCKKTMTEEKTIFKKEKNIKKEDLENALKKALEKEDYEKASQIRDKIKEKENITKKT